MQTLNPALVILIGLVLRLIVPLAITALIVYSLGKLDARWQAEAKNEKKTLAIDEMPCAKIQGFSVDQMKMHMSLSDQPCWQAHRSPNGYLSETCLSCEIFLNAPVPAPATHAPM